MQYDKTFKEEAIKLSEEIGVKAVAAQLGIPYYTLAGWRTSLKKYGSKAMVGSDHKRTPASEAEQRIRELEKENAELKRAKILFFRQKWKQS